MFSRTSFVPIAAIGAIAATVALALPAQAAPTTSVYLTAGSSGLGTPVNVTATSTNAILFRNSRPSSGASITCPSGVVLGGVATTGKNKSPNAVGSITNSTWPTGASGCKVAGGAATFSHGSGSSWSVNFPTTSSGNSTNPNLAPQPGQVTTGNIGKTGGQINLHVTVSGCGFDLKGSVPISYDNDDGTVVIIFLNDGTVIIIVSGAPASGCAAGLIQNGDQFALEVPQGGSLPRFNVTGRVSSNGAAANPVRVSATNP